MAFTALDKLMENCSRESSAAEFSRSGAKNNPTCVKRARSVGYHEGRANAYNDAHRIMQAELRRLMNKLQNGALSPEDFGVEP